MPALFEKITSESNFDEAYKNTLKGKNRFAREAMVFMKNETHNLNKLRQSVIDGEYRFQGYQRFTVYEPKMRIIDAPHFTDKVVQLAINKILKDVYQPCFIYDSYASLDNKGTHKCVDRISYFMRKANWETGGKAYILKMDIRKFFYTIDREILKKILKKKIRCEETERLLHIIIDSADAIDRVGLPLGNTLSQLFANIYLNELDQYAKRKLSIKYYIRYMDDVIAILPNKKEAARTLALLEDFIKKNLALELNHDKTKLFPIRQGVNAIGFKIHTTHRLLRNSSKKKIKQKARTMKSAMLSGKMTPEKAEQILNSWNGHAKHGNSYNFIQKLLAKHDYIETTARGALTVNREVLARREAG